MGDFSRKLKFGVWKSVLSIAIIVVACMAAAIELNWQPLDNNSNIKAVKGEVPEYEPNKYQVVLLKDGEKQVSIPILRYHYIQDGENDNDLIISTAQFREQMEFLKRKGYTTLTLDEVYSCFTEDKPVPEKSVVITFDDGYMDNYTNAYPILKELNFKATIYVITSLVDKHPDHLTSAQLVELQNNGIDIESHTVNHDKLDDLTYEEQVTVLAESKKALETIVNKEIKYIAYPFGSYNDDTIKALEDTGYKMAVTIIEGRAAKDDGVYGLHRIYVGKSYDLKKFKKALKGKLQSIEA